MIETKNSAVCDPEPPSIADPFTADPFTADPVTAVSADVLEGAPISEAPLVDATVVDASVVEVSDVEAADPPTWPRTLGHLRGPAGGPTLIVVGGLHGNEPAGVLALERLLEELTPNIDHLAGSFAALVGNRRGLDRRERFLEEDMNRIWTHERVSALRAGMPPRSIEDAEMGELDAELRAILEKADGPVFLLDLHTTSAPGPAFNVLNDTLPNRDFTLSIPAPTVLGLEEELSGTLLGYLTRNHDLRTAGFESGQHDDPIAIDIAVAAIWIVLGESGVTPEAEWPQVRAARRMLETASRSLPHVVDIQHRHHIEPEDGFCMRPGFRGFQQVYRGDVLAEDHRGEIRAPMDGLLLMPLYQGLGEDGFFIVRTVRRFWLELSAIVRRWHLVEHLNWLPGIRKHPTLEDAFIVDKRIARVLAVEFFHLMGMTRVGPAGERYVTMRRRSYDP